MPKVPVRFCLIVTSIRFLIKTHEKQQKPASQLERTGWWTNCCFNIVLTLVRQFNDFSTLSMLMNESLLLGSSHKRILIHTRTSHDYEKFQIDKALNNSIDIYRSPSFPYGNLSLSHFYRIVYDAWTFLFYFTKKISCSIAETFCCSRKEVILTHYAFRYLLHSTVRRQLRTGWSANTNVRRTTARGNWICKRIKLIIVVAIDFEMIETLSFFSNLLWN